MGFGVHQHFINTLLVNALHNVSKLFFHYFWAKWAR